MVSPLLRRERVALGVLALGTVAFMPGALNRFVFVKVALMAVGVALAFTVPRRGRLNPKIVVILSIGTLILLIATLRGSAPFPALVGVAPRYEGVFVLTVYVGAAVAGARLLGPNRADGSMSWFLSCLALASVFLGLEAALEMFGLRPLASNVARPGSLLGNASDEGAWAVLVLGPLAAVAARTRKWPYILGSLAAIITLIASGSRGALIGAVILAGVLIMLEPHRSLRVIFVAGIVVLALGSLATPATRNRVIGASPYSLETVHGRELLWAETLHLVEDHPVLGVGLGGYLNAIPQYHDRRWEREIGPSNPPDSPHNWILQAGADGGILLAMDALALALVVILCGLGTTRRQKTRGERAATVGMLAGVIGYGAALLFHLTSPGTTPLAAVLAGSLVSVPVRSTIGDQLSPARTKYKRPVGSSGFLKLVKYAQFTLFCALALLLMLAAIAEIPLRLAINDAASGRLDSANGQFHLAADLRPWDPSIDQTAGHAFAVLASYGEPSAASLGLFWTSRELENDPNGVIPLEDAAAVDEEINRSTSSATLLRRAMQLDPTNPVVLLELGRLETTLGHHREAERILTRAAYFAPNNEQIRAALRQVHGSNS
jgi:O-antigen ligase